MDTRNAAQHIFKDRSSARYQVFSDTVLRGGRGRESHGMVSYSPIQTTDDTPLVSELKQGFNFITILRIHF